MPGSLLLLSTLDLRYNEFEKLPDFLLNLSMLTYLELANNPLTSVPKEIYEREENPFSNTLRYMLQVRLSRSEAHKLNLSNFAFTYIPPQVLSMMATQDLDLQGNNLTRLPEDICFVMPSLTRLCCRRNQLVSPLPLKLALLTALTTLDVASNKLESLPVGIASLTRLRTLGFAGNPIQLPTTALLSADMPAVRAILGAVAAAGVGASASVYTPTVYAKDTDGRDLTLLSGPAVAPYARPAGHAAILVQHGIRRGCSLQEAVDDAREGALILLRPGVHKGPIVLRHAGVTLGGDTSGGDCIIEAGNERVRPGGERMYAAVVCTALNTKLYNVTVRWTGAPFVEGGEGGVRAAPQPTTAVLVASGVLTLVNCDIRNPQGCGVMVRRQADASILANHIEGCGGSGISLEAGVSAHVRYNDIIKCKGAGVLVVEGANPLIEACRIVRGLTDGIQVATGGLGVIKNNDIALNSKAGIDIRSGGDPVVQGNRIVKNLVGVLCADRSRGKLLDNTITDSATAGISVTTGSVVEATSNTIVGMQKAVGMIIADEGTRVVVREHEVHGVGNGLVVAQGAHVEFINSRIFHVKDDGVIARGKGTLLALVQSEVFGNQAHGVRFLAAAEAKLLDVKVCVHTYIHTY